jgi:hypothetical protein
MNQKSVNIRMSEDFHSVLKSYCAFIGKTMGEVIYDWIRQELHQQSMCSITLQSWLNAHNKKLDNRATKSCWGYRCNLCEHETLCRCGKTDELFILKKQWSTFMRPECCEVHAKCSSTACNTPRSETKLKCIS